MSRNLSLLISLFLIFHFSQAQNKAIQVEKYELSNGFTVYLNEDKNASNVYGCVWVNAGGKNDPADATGIAHYLEHMLFKGTNELGTQNYEKEKVHLDSIKYLYDQLAMTPDKDAKLEIQKQINAQELKASNYAIPNEFDKLLKSIGASRVNASTSNDWTNYYNFFPPNQIERWLDLYAHRFQNPVFRLFQSELETVYEEKNRAGDDLERRVYEKFNEYIYGDHPYSTQTVLGSVEHLKNPSLSKMYQYFEDYYVANNMALVLCGNFNSEEVKPYIEKSFGQLKRRDVPSFPDYPIKEFKGREQVKVRITPIKAGFLGYKMVPEGHQDRPALDLIGYMMSNEDETGFIDQMTLNNEVIYAGGFQEFLEDDGSTFIFYVPKVFGKGLKKFENQIRDQFAKIEKGDFTDDYFQAVKNNIYKNYNLSLERLNQRGYYLGMSFINDLDYNRIFSYPDQIQKLTKEDIQKAAAKYYGEDYFVMQSRTGFPKKVKLKKPPYKPIQSRTEEVSAYAENFEKIPEQKLNAGFIDPKEDVSIIDDYLYYTKNPVNDIFTLRLMIAGGINKEGSYPLLARALRASGTAQYSPSQLKEEFAKLGCSYSISADYNSFDITLTGIDGKFDEAVALMKQLLTSFKPTDKTIEYLYNQRSTENKLNKNNPATGGRTLYAYGLFGNESAYMKRMPAAELKKLEPQKLSAQLNDLLANGFSNIHYVGQKDQGSIREAFSKDDFFKKNTVDKYTYLEAKSINETTIYLVNDKKAIQSYVYYIVNGEPLNHKEYPKKEAFNAYYTNSLSGLLFQEVREFRSLAYATGGNYIDPVYEPNKKGRLVLFTGSQADKTTDAVEVVLGLINDMPVYENRMDAIREGVILKSGSSKPAFRELSYELDLNMKTGFKEDPNQLIFENGEALTFDDIQNFYEANIKNKPVTITIYGDASEFDVEKLKKYGKVVELTINDIRVE